MGVLDKDENISEEIVDIMEFYNMYITDGYVLTFGDELTVERQHGALEDMRRGRTHSERLEGLIPVLSDFHAFGNFLEV